MIVLKYSFYKFNIWSIQQHFLYKYNRNIRCISYNIWIRHTYTAGVRLENPKDGIVTNTIYVNSSLQEQIYDGVSNEYCAYTIFLNDYLYMGGKLYDYEAKIRWMNIFQVQKIIETWPKVF